MWLTRLFGFGRVLSRGLGGWTDGRIDGWTVLVAETNSIGSQMYAITHRYISRPHLLNDALPLHVHFYLVTKLDAHLGRTC